jgi:hypothetical protein
VLMWGVFVGFPKIIPWSQRANMQRANVQRGVVAPLGRVMMTIAPLMILIVLNHGYIPGYSHYGLLDEF